MIIYKITNKINGKSYIGKALNGFKRRYSSTPWYTSRNVNKYLYRSILKYGIENFEVTILYDILVKNNNLLNDLEKQEIVKFNSIHPNGYNFTSGGDGGFTFSQETLNKMSKVKIGKKASEETKRKRSIISKLLDLVPPKPTKNSIRLQMIKNNRIKPIIAKNLKTLETKEYTFIADVKQDNFCPVLVRQKCNHPNMKQEYNGWVFEYKDKKNIRPFKTSKTKQLKNNSDVEKEVK